MDLVKSQKTFFKLVESIPPAEAVIFKKVSSQILTNNSSTFTRTKDSEIWNSKIMDHLTQVVNQLPDDGKTKNAVISKLKFIVKFAIETLKKQSLV